MAHMTIRNFIVLTLVLIPLAALAGCTPNYKATDLDGIWIGQDQTINSRGKSLTTKTVTLTVDGDGRAYSGRCWCTVGSNELVDFEPGFITLSLEDVEAG